MEGVKSLECGPEELPGVWGVERSEGGGGNWGGPPRPDGPAGAVGASRPITGDPGKWARAGRASEAAVVPLAAGRTTQPPVREGPLRRQFALRGGEGQASADHG